MSVRNAPAELVVALDMQDVQAARMLAQQLRGIVPWLKVGLELFILAGPDIVKYLKDMGYKVFVDLKMYDIPHTVRGGVLSAVSAGADMLTIHIQGGERMARAAVQAAKESVHAQQPIILGVTVLTSMENGELPTYSGSLPTLVTDLAVKAYNWGLHGIVSSGHEVAAIKSCCAKDFLCLTPGIRPLVKTEEAMHKNTQSMADDQRRIMTPVEAVRAGADFLVLGRPITQAKNPVQVARSVTQDIQEFIR